MDYRIEGELMTEKDFNEIGNESRIKEEIKNELQFLSQNAKFYENRIIIGENGEKDFYKLVKENFEKDKIFMKEICGLDIKLFDYKIERLEKNCVIIIKNLIIN